MIKDGKKYKDDKKVKTGKKILKSIETGNIKYLLARQKFTKDGDVGKLILNNLIYKRGINDSKAFIM